MIGVFTRWSLGVSPVSHEEKWHALEEVTADLYPTGPDHDGLWSRAGGRHADLQSVGSGRTRWRDAIGQVRHGNGPHPAQLLREMSRDYPNNDQLRRLAADLGFGDGSH